ncbi:MAG: 16S rRNA (guanine(527)-N(7))-methyltransferase RsmG [Cyanobacteria bacterium NC_groundwater_1444_Ag_S-0.65um_54_12]|nr:16S rRNA (guanine(527)-N(7))-methyltransferase RsmG [Cyanobacteria bacterium NC_groundwater_1444_Ag_S-0.65um_54_12]
MDGAKAYGPILSVDQVSAFQCYYQVLVAGNVKQNLTRITGEREVVLKHFLDSLSYLVGIPVAWQRQKICLLDVGSGAGFPGIPLLIACQNWVGVLLEATRKKVEFLEQTVEALSLSDRVVVRWGRAETAPISEHGLYDLVTARAVTGIRTLVGWALPLVRVGGLLVLSQGPKNVQDIASSTTAVHRAGGKILRLIPVELPEKAGKRFLVVIERQAKSMVNLSTS